MDLPSFDPKNIKLPKSTAEIDKIFDELKLIARSKPDYQVIKKAYFDKVCILPIYTIKVNADELSELFIYRSRSCEQIDIKKINNISEFGAPPINKDCGVGRANWRCRNVFYGSDCIETSYLESKNNSTEGEFYISRWSFNLGKLSDYIPIDVRVLLKEDLPSSNPLHKIAKSVSFYIEKSFHEFDFEQKEIIKYIHEILCERFLSANKIDYPVTAFIADYQLFNSSNSDDVVYFPILIYPSIGNGYRSCNYAIHPRFVYNYMNLDRVVHFKVEQKGDNGFEYKLIKLAKRISPSTIQWYHLNPNIDKATWLIQTVMCGVTERILYQFDGKDNEFEIEDLDESFPKMVNQYLFTNKNSIMESITIPNMDFKDTLSLTHKFSLIGKDKSTDPIKCIRLSVTVLIQIPVEYSPIMN